MKSQNTVLGILPWHFEAGPRDGIGPLGGATFQISEI